MLCAGAFTPAHSSASCVRLKLKAAQVIENCLAPAVDMRPVAITDAIPRTCHVDHIAVAMRCWNTVVRLLVRDDDNAVVRLAQAPQSMAELRSTVGLAGDNRVTQSKAATGRYPNQFVGKAVYLDCFANFTKQHSQSARSIHTQHLRTASQRRIHAAGGIDQQYSAAGKLLPPRDSFVHCLLQCFLPLWRVPGRSQEAEGQNTLCLHRGQRVDDGFVIDTSILHIAKVAQKRECTQFALREQPLRSEERRVGKE